MKRGTFFLIACILIGCTVLFGLGMWQLNRLEWKEGVIAKVEKNLRGEPVEVSKVFDEVPQGSGDINYYPIKISGTYAPIEPLFEFTTFKGASGWNLYALFKTAEQDRSALSEYVVINRGFIPYNKRKEFEGVKPPSGAVELVGLLRSPPGIQPSAAFDNELANRTFYWRDIVAMATVFEKDPSAVAHWYVDLGLPKNKVSGGELPIAGTTLINFPNNHFQYALTWFGLGGTLLVVGGSFLWSRRQKNEN